MKQFTKLAFGTKMASKCYSNLILLKDRKLIQGNLYREIYTPTRYY